VYLFGADNQIPYTNTTTDDFDYSAIHTFDGTHLRLKADNSKLYFGTADDASITYDGTDLLINTKEVGTGTIKINGTAAYSGVDIDYNSLDITLSRLTYAPAMSLALSEDITFTVTQHCLAH